ncbi:MAG: hypothetical protein QG597_3600 [Actinomycetota bacterium]|nr:hypothetical protein [Actinomycetota bacterium]
MRSARTRRYTSWVLLVVGAVVLAVAGLAVAANAAFADSESFASRLNEVRKDPAVAAEAGQVASDQIIAAKPDLVAVKPLLEGVATWVVGSTALDQPFTATAREVHRSLTTDDGNAVVLRLVDLGAAVTGALATLAPDLADKIPPDLTVTLSEIGSGSALQPIIAAATTIYVLAWALPFVGATALVAAALVAPNRRQGVLRAGGACLIAAGVVAFVVVAGAAAAFVQPENTLAGAFIKAAWRDFGSAFLPPLLLLSIIGLFLVAAAGALLPRLRVRDLLVEGWDRLTGRQNRPSLAVARALAVVAIGLAVVVWPSRALQVAAVVAGLLIVLAGMAEISRLAAARIAAEESSGDDVDPVPRRWLVTAGAGAGVAVLLGAGVALAAAPPATQAPSEVVAAVNDPNGPCNGAVELCDRRYNDIAFPAAHNAMSAADLPGWYLPEQPTSLVGALQAGVRVLLFDTWYGQQTDRGVITVPGDRAAAEAQAREQFGDATVDSALRVTDAVRSDPTGAVRPYMCHTLCELGATDLEESMAGVHAWLQNNPREVVSFFIQDVVTPADTAAVLTRTGLADMAYTPRAGEPFPTLREMIDADTRLVVLMENEGGGATYPYLLPGFEWVQETPYTFATVADFTCAANRGPADAPLFQLNHWLAGFGTLVSDAALVNATGVLGPRADQCQAERGQIPNFVAVNYYNLGGLFDVVDQLNGVGAHAPGTASATPSP